jgi:hypothetical protein
MPHIFQHRSPAPTVRRAFPACIREDFVECCAYCLLHEIAAGGKENYELDHHRPRAKFPDQVKTYENHYYSCHVCNHEKGFKWPSDQQLRLGYRFVDPCRERFSDHFDEADNGYWSPRTPAGLYTAKHIGLNREHLRLVRGMLISVCAEAGRPRIDWDRPVRDQVLALWRMRARAPEQDLFGGISFPTELGS